MLFFQITVLAAILYSDAEPFEQCCSRVTIQVMILKAMQLLLKGNVFSAGGYIVQSSGTSELFS